MRYLCIFFFFALSLRAQMLSPESRYAQIQSYAEVVAHSVLLDSSLADNGAGSLVAHRVLIYTNNKTVRFTFLNHASNGEGFWKRSGADPQYLVPANSWTVVRFYHGAWLVEVPSSTGEWNYIGVLVVSDSPSSLVNLFLCFAIGFLFFWFLLSPLEL